MVLTQGKNRAKGDKIKQMLFFLFTFFPTYSHRRLYLFARFARAKTANEGEPFSIKLAAAIGTLNQFEWQLIKLKEVQD